jgi:hypothetical protein
MPDTLEPAGGGRYPGDMESRVAALEQVARTTAGTLARLEQRFDNVDHRFEAVDRHFEAVDRQFVALDGRFGAVDRRFESLERRMDLLISEHHIDFRWLVALILGQTVAVLGVMAHGFHWL